MVGGEPQLNRSTTDKRSWNPDVYYSQVLEEVHGMAPGAIWGAQGRGQAERKVGLGVGHMSLLGSMGEMFWGSWGKVGLVNSNQK